jgi:tetratricopeptide (TPR) repeat protein
MYTNRKTPLDDGWFWVPNGLVWRLKLEKELPSLTEFKAFNDAAWAQLSDPTEGILSRYNHLLLSDVLDVYTAARIAYGKVLLRGNDVTGALSQFKTAASYGSDTNLPEAYTYIGLANLFSKDCKAAEAAFVKARQVSLVPDKSLTLYEAAVANDCEKNETKAQTLLDAYEEARKKEDVLLGAR